jgi:hypothetical protein
VADVKDQDSRRISSNTSRAARSAAIRIFQTLADTLSRIGLCGNVEPMLLVQHF